MRTYMAIGLIVVSPLMVFAHGGGFSHEEQIGEYVVDIGYDQAPVAGERIVFDFALSNAAGAPVPFEYVWVRIEHDGTALIATGPARAEFGPTSLLYAIPSTLSGDLTIRARYQKGDDTLAETSFTLPVSEAPRNSADFLPYAVGIGGVLLGAWMTFIMRKKWMV